MSNTDNGPVEIMKEELRKQPDQRKCTGCIVMREVTGENLLKVRGTMHVASTQLFTNVIEEAIRSVTRIVPESIHFDQKRSRSNTFRHESLARAIHLVVCPHAQQYVRTHQARA